jgi:thiol-disulfide isomerase/thioredoxin
MLSLVAILLVGCNRPATSAFEGGSAPQVELPGAGGVAQLLGESTGRLQLIGFWASWSGPCRQQEPELVALLERHQDVIDFTRVNVSDDVPGPSDAAASKTLPGSEVWDVEGLARSLYEVDVLPLSIVLDGEGLVTYRGTQLPTDQHIGGDRQ